MPECNELPFFDEAVDLSNLECTVIAPITSNHDEKLNVHFLAICLKFITARNHGNRCVINRAIMKQYGVIS